MGLFGYIIPNKFFQSEYGEALRELLRAGNHLREIVSFGHQQVFSHATTYTCLLLLGKSPSEAFIVRLPVLAEWRKSGTAPYARFAACDLSATEWNFMLGESTSVRPRLESNSIRLDEIADVFVGVQTSADEVFILDFVEPRAGIAKLHSRSLETVVELEPDLLHPVVSGTNVSAYDPLPSRQWILFPYRVENERAELVEWVSLSTKYPKTASYLLKNKERLAARESNTFDDERWYRFGRSQNLGIQSRQKSAFPVWLSRYSERLTRVARIFWITSTSAA